MRAAHVDPRGVKSSDYNDEKENRAISIVLAQQTKDTRSKNDERSHSRQGGVMAFLEKKK